MRTARQLPAPPRQLRFRAERLLATTPREVAGMPVEDVQKLVHELQVHQVELEMQNAELTRTQSVLEQAQSRYADLYDSAPFAYLTLNRNGGILAANLSAGRLLDLERDRLLQQKFTHFVAAVAQDTFYLFFRKVFNSVGPQSVELELTTASGRRLVAHVDAVRDQTSPRQQCRLGLADITPRRNVEEELRASQAKLTAALDSMTDAVFISDAQGQLIDFNPAFATFHKFKSKQECVRRLSEYSEILEISQFDGTFVPLENWPILRALRGETFTNAEYVLRRKDTSETWAGSYNVAPIRDQNGVISGAVGVACDITARRKAEQRIAQLTRVQAILTGVNRAIAHMSDQGKLLDEVCRVAVEVGGFKLAWVGMVAPSGVVEPVAKAGATGYLEGIRVVALDVPEGRGPVGLAIRENRPVVVEDIYQDERMRPWLDRARNFGLRYVAAFPLRIAGKVAGAFQVYAPQPGFFSQPELALLTQVSDDLSFALTAFSELAARKQAETALIESNRFTQQIIASAKDGIVVYDRDMRYLVWNPFMEVLTGMPASAVLGKHPLEVFPWLRNTGVIEELKQVLAGAASSTREFEFVLPETGRSGWASDINGPLRDARGEIIGAIGIVRDITGPKQVEQSLRRTERTLTEFFNHAPVGIQWLASEGKILRANHTQLHLLGYSAAEYLGHFFGEFCADPTGGDALLRRLAAGETVNNLRLRLRCKDGTPLTVLVDARPLHQEGRFVYSSLFTRDITDRVNLEREILEISEREQRRIAQDLHDGLGQLLVGTAYLASLLRQQLAARSSPETRRMDRLLRALDEAVRQTRSLARGLYPVKPETDGLMLALRDLAARTRRFFQVACRFTCRQPVLLGDNSTATHLYRIAQEAVTNAIKHGRPDRISINLAGNPGRICLVVSDNGAGLPIRSRKHRGMGLRIMHYRAGVINGTLEIRRGATGGTVVRCTVPDPPLETTTSASVK